MDEYKQFDIVYADLSSKGTIGSEQKGIRPVIIIQNDTGNIHSPTVLVMALTKELKKANQPTHYIIRKMCIRDSFYTGRSSKNWTARELFDGVLTEDQIKEIFDSEV